MSTPPRRRPARWAAATAVAFVLLCLPALAPLAAGAVPSARQTVHQTAQQGAPQGERPSSRIAAQAPLGARSVSITVADVTPTSPTSSSTPRPLSFRLQLHNGSDQQLGQVTITAVRGDPIAGQQALDQALSRPQTPSQAEPITPRAPVTASLAARGDATVTFRTTTDITTVDAGLCLCQDRIYPIVFTASVTDQTTGASSTVGTAQTVLPSFGFTRTPVRTKVSWLWPLLERPHRLTAGSVFIDDDLASSIDGGRLDRMLQVLQNVSASVPMTVVVDPELLAEISTMARGNYVVRALGSTRTTPGTGKAAAVAWLARFTGVLKAHPDVEVELTPNGDPDVAGLVAHGFGYKAASASVQAARSVLGSTVPDTSVAWPSTSSVDADTLDQLVQHGARVVIMSDTNLTRARQGSPRPDALAPLQTTTGPVVAGVLSSSVQRFVAPVLSLDGSGSAQLPQLVSEIAVRAAEQPGSSHYVLVAPPRYLDPSVTVATRAIKATAAAFWSAPVTMSTAIAEVHPVDQGSLTTGAASDGGLSDPVVTVAQRYLQLEPAVTSMLSNADAASLIGGLPASLQLAESSAWEQFPGSGQRFAEQIGAQLDAIQRGVFIVTPATRNYTLASSNSPLPVTVENDLKYPVTVRVEVSAVVAGFRADLPTAKRIAPGEKLTLHIPTHTDRTGRFDVRAVLTAPNGSTLDSVQLTVHSTALGVIGIVITIVSGSLLVVALGVRYRKRAKLRAAARSAAGAGTRS